ncbi:MAG: hypothetical protein SNJ81_14320 [Cyanobacteriota bacterium]
MFARRILWCADTAPNPDRWKPKSLASSLCDRPIRNRTIRNRYTLGSG